MGWWGKLTGLYNTPILLGGGKDEKIISHSIIISIPFC